MFTMLSSAVVSYLNNFAIAAGCDPGKTFFGLPVWYKYVHGVKKTSGFCDFDGLQIWPPNDLLLVGVAILDMLLRIAGMVAVGFVIWGGISYVLSQGEPDKTKEAQQTIINALIGLAFALVAIALVSFLGVRLAGK